MVCLGHDTTTEPTNDAYSSLVEAAAAHLLDGGLDDGIPQRSLASVCMFAYHEVMEE